MSFWLRLKMYLNGLIPFIVSNGEYRELQLPRTRVVCPKTAHRHLRSSLLSLLRQDGRLIKALKSKKTYVLDVIPRQGAGVTIGVFLGYQDRRDYKPNSVANGGELRPAYHPKLEARGQFRYIVKNGSIEIIDPNKHFELIVHDKPIFTIQPGWWENRSLPFQ